MSKIGKWLIILFVLGLIALLFRIGAHIPAGALSFVLFLAALAQRIMALHYTKKMYDQQSGGASATQNSEIGRKEALEILELDDKATDDDIKKSYKKLMAKVHPDTGGSKYLAAKLNQAKDVLLKK